jgi:hypothetical protein
MAMPASSHLSKIAHLHRVVWKNNSTGIVVGTIYISAIILFPDIIIKEKTYTLVRFKNVTANRPWDNFN